MGVAAEREVDRAAGVFGGVGGEFGGVGGEFGGERLGVADRVVHAQDASALRTAERAWRAAVRSAVRSVRKTPSSLSGWPAGVVVSTEASFGVGCLQAGHMRDRPPWFLSWRSGYLSPSRVRASCQPIPASLTTGRSRAVPRWCSASREFRSRAQPRLCRACLYGRSKCSR